MLGSLLVKKSNLNELIWKKECPVALTLAGDDRQVPTVEQATGGTMEVEWRVARGGAVGG